MNKKWQRLDKDTVYNGWVKIIKHSVLLPDGTKSDYEIDHRERGAAACLVFDGENILLAYQYRFALDKMIFDLPGGMIDAGESGLQAAKRECQEEIGIKPIDIHHLTTFCPNPGRSNWYIELYFCDKYEKALADTDNASEIIEMKKVTVHKLEEMINSGEIVDPSLLIAWHTAKARNLL